MREGEAPLPHIPDTQTVTAYTEGGVEVLRALASEPRLAILRLLAGGPRNVAEIGQSIRLAQPTVTKHVQILERAGLLTSEYLPGTQGMQKRCTLTHERLLISLQPEREPTGRIHELSMPIGLYTLAYARPTCGLASSTGLIGMLDDPTSFFAPERAGAELLWTSNGFVEYVFSGGLPTSRPLERLEFMAEMCSEAPHSNSQWPSDLTLWIDGVEIATWTSLGDHSARRGRLNPTWWPDHMTQHGVLKVWSIDGTGAFVDGVLAGSATIEDLRLAPGHPITVRLGVKPDAEHRGGFNLFGKGFGDYAQDLLLRLHYGETPTNSAQTGQERAAVYQSFVEPSGSSV